MRWCGAGLIGAGLLLSACASARPEPAVATSPPPPTPAQKLAWILALEDGRVGRGPAPGQDLVAMLGDELAHIRRRAALAAGRVRLIDAVVPLSAMLAAEPDPEVRQMAAFALGIIGSPTAAESLIGALTVPAPLVQGRSAEALGAIGHKAAAPAIAAMMAVHIGAGALDGLAADDVGHPKSPGTEAVRLGLYALVRLGAYDQIASTILDEAGLPRSRWWPIAYALQRVGDPRAAAPLMALLQADGQVTRAFASRGLGALKHAPAVTPLTALAADAAQPAAVRVQAIRALAAIGHPAAGPHVLKILTTPGVDPMLQLEAVTAVGQLRVSAAMDALFDLASAPWPSMRAAALVALARIDADIFIGAISSLDDDPHWSVRAALATALGDLGGERGEARLTRMLADQDQRVVPAVLSALVASRAPSAVAALGARLASEDPVVRMAAANGLARLKAVGHSAALEAALAASASDSTYVARAAMLAALSSLDPASGRTALVSALSDANWSVRVRAADLLRQLDAAADARPSTPATPVPGLVADASIAPPYSPMAYVDTDKGTIQIELAVIDAPRTVLNFIALVRKGFFDGVAWHRVVPDFVVQSGDPRGDGEGGPGYTIRDEINQRPYLRGTVGMALDWADTGGSQFFITHSPQPHLDGRYTAFGQVVSGMDVVDRLQQWDQIRRVRVWDGLSWIGAPGER